MAFKPADFFVGVVDFFSILLPGAAFAFAGLDFAPQIFGGFLPALRGGIADWATFAVAAYVLGHFISQVGAATLDKIYKWSYLKIRKRGSGNDLFDHVRRLMAKEFAVDRHIAEPFKWARTDVRLRSPVAAQEIDRLEADSKFFRSMTVVLLAFAILAIGWPRRHVEHKPLWIAITIGLSLFSFLRFSNLRWKCGEAAFLSLAVLEKREEQGKSITASA